MNIITKIEQGFLKAQLPVLKPGDQVRVHVRIVEGEKERVQIFESVLIKRKGESSRETITVRKISYGIGVERVFPLHSPRIEQIEVVGHGHVRRAKLYYLRQREGRAARLKEKKYVETAAPAEKPGPGTTPPPTPANP